MLWCIAAGIVGNTAAAEDVVQEAVVIAWGKFAQFHPPATGNGLPAAPLTGVDTLPAFTAWMGQIVRYVGLNQHRKDQRHMTVSLSQEQEDSPRTRAAASRPLQLTPGGQLPDEQQEFDDRVLHALQEVNEVARACLLLRTIEGLDYQRIAQLLDIPAGTAMSHVHRARQFLRQRLADRQPRSPRTKNIPS